MSTRRRKNSKTIQIVHRQAARPHTLPANKLLLPSHIVDKLMETYRLRRTWQATRDRAMKAEFNKLQKEVRKETTEFKNKNWAGFLEGLEPLGSNIWKVCRTFTKCQTKISPLQQGTTTASTNAEKAEVIAASLEQQFAPNSYIYTGERAAEVNVELTNVLADHTSGGRQITVMLSDLLTKIAGLKEGKSLGHDNIIVKMVKHLPGNVIIFMAALINAIFEFRTFPNSWKLVKITPLPKSAKT